MNKQVSIGPSYVARTARVGFFFLSFWLMASLVFASDLKLQLTGPVSVIRQSISYRCPTASSGLPSTFAVEYVHDGTNTLALLPIGGHSVILIGIPAASGSKYVGGHYTWTEAEGHGASLTVDRGRRDAKEYRCERAGRN